MRLFYFLELLATLAVGLAACRNFLSYRGELLDFVAFFAHPDLSSGEWWSMGLGWLWDSMSVFLWAVAPAIGLGLAIETASRRKVSWGFGRLIISVCSIYVSISLIDSLVWVWKGGEKITWGQVYEGNSERLESLTWVVVAYALTLWFSGRPRDSLCDAREWTGRIYAVATLLPVLIGRIFF